MNFIKTIQNSRDKILRMYSKNFINGCYIENLALYCIIILGNIYDPFLLQF